MQTMLQDEKGQGAIEYILLIAGALVFVVLVLVLVKQYIFAPTTNNTKENTGQFFNLVKDFKKE